MNQRNRRKLKAFFLISTQAGMYSPSLTHLQELPVITVFSTACLHQHEPAAHAQRLPPSIVPASRPGSFISLPLSLP